MGIFEKLFGRIAKGDTSPIVPGDSTTPGYEKFEEEAKQEALGRRFVWIVQGKNEPSVPAFIPLTLDPSDCKRFTLEVVGESYYQENLWRIAHTAHPEYGARVIEKAYLILDDANPYDSNAVRVDMMSLQVGHLSREKAVWYRERLAAGSVSNVCHGLIRGGFQDVDGRARLGVMLDLQAKRTKGVRGSNMQDRAKT